MNVIIVGRIGTDEAGKKRGEMARSLIEGCKEAGIPHMRLDGAPFPPEGTNLPFKPDPNSVVVYVSSKERFPSVLDECELQNFPLIVATSGIRLVEEEAKELTIPVIMAPNLALLILALFDVLPRFALLSELIRPRRVTIVEGHQNSKTSIPATVLKLAEMFKVSSEEVGHIRSDPVAETILDVPPEMIGGFGAHFLKVTAGGVEVKIQFKTLGRAAYFLGLEVILQAIEKMGPNLKPGVHEAHKLVFPPDPINEELAAKCARLTKELRDLRSTMMDIAHEGMQEDVRD